MRIYGYARISSKDQNEARQLDAFTKLGLSSEQIFVNKVSGKNFDRPAHQQLMHS